MTRLPAACLRLERRVADHTARFEALRPRERVLLLLSGGADSMALLRLLPAIDRRLGLDLEPAALHVDYATRGRDSDRDREIVERACAAAGVPLHVVRLRRRLTGGDFQARARDLRYRRARELAAEHGYGVIVTAHNRDDQAETILYRLAKYAAPRGLVGMRPRDGDLSRPLLCLGAAEIREYCRAMRVEYGEDVTNATTVYARNRIRLEVVPALEAINPRLSETLSAAALQAAAEADVLDAAVTGARARILVAPASAAGADLAAVDLARLAAEPPALRALVLHELVREAMGGEALVERRHVDALLRLAGRPDDAGRVSLGRGLEAVRERGRLHLRRARTPHACVPASVDGLALVAAGEDGLRLVFCGGAYRARLLPGAVLDRAAALAGQAIAGLGGPPRRVTLRHARRGERFAPLGLGEETTVARFLAGARAPAAARLLALVLDVDGRAVWVGHAAADGTPVGRVAQDSCVAQSSAITLHVFQEGS